MSLADLTRYDWLKKQYITNVIVTFHNTGFSVELQRGVGSITDVYTTLDEVKQAFLDANSVNFRLKAEMEKCLEDKERK